MADTSLAPILIPALAGLFGAIIGGLITFFVNRTNNQTQRTLQIQQYRVEQLDKKRSVAEKIIKSCIEIKARNGAIEDLGDIEQAAIFDQNMEIIKQVQVLVVIYFPKLSDQVNKMIGMYTKSEFDETKQERFMAGIVHLNTEKWILINMIKDEISSNENEIVLNT